jgi:hypothetical protein
MCAVACSWRLHPRWAQPLRAKPARSFLPRNLADLSREELDSIEITSVSKRAERLSDAPASDALDVQWNSSSSI